MSKINKLNHLETRGRSKLSADYDQAPKKVPKLPILLASPKFHPYGKMPS